MYLCAGCANVLMQKIHLPYITLLTLLLCYHIGAAQRPVAIDDDVQQYIFSFQEIEYLEDVTGALTIDEISSPTFSESFSASPTFSPENYNRSSAYWYRIRVKHNALSTHEWKIEFFDQTIDRIDFFVPLPGGGFQHHSFGDNFLFDERPIHHKNFFVKLPDEYKGTQTYYFKVKSRQQANILVVLRTSDYFINYALDEYFFFGIFYGMILVFCFYNLLMFAAVREKHYLYYILYLLSIGLYEMSADGIAYQYLWPTAVDWNQYAPGFMLYLASTFALFFASSLLNLTKQYPKLQYFLTGVFIFRTVFLVLSLTVAEEWFRFRFIEVVPFGAAFFASIYCLLKGYRPARFLVVGYSFLFLGIIIKLIQYLDFNWLPLGSLTHYSLGFGFIMEMMFLSFANSDKIRVMRIDKERAQRNIIEQLHINQELKDTLNQQLEQQVEIKTQQLVEKSDFIARQNRQLAEANQQLARQAEEITAMNALLAQDNLQLKHDVEVVTEARILSRDVDFEEFSAMYPDDDSCLKFMANLKWATGYGCSRCGHNNFSEGRAAYGRRCTKCGYDESVTAYTLLQNTRLPINKAFYMIFLVYASKGNISSHKLSSILHIRQSTCWAYSTKIKKAIKDRNKQGGIKHEGWDSILFIQEAAH
jgi:two-component system, sensor histidine kinase LadS